MSLNITVPQPYGLKFHEWGALVAEQLARYGVGAPVTDEWKPWVCALFYIPELVAKNIPTPDHYPTWNAWANQFVEAVR